MIVKVELSDNQFNLLAILDAEIQQLTWEYDQLGGCGPFSFILGRQYCNEQAISGDFNVKIFGRNPSTKNYDLWYQGIVEDKIPDITNQDETVEISGHGYAAQLQRIQLVSVTFTNMEASAIITSLLNSYIVPNTDISYSAMNIQATGFTFDTITFNTDVQSAIQTIVDTVGAIEWGVDANRSLYFIPESTTTGLRFAVGDKMTTFNDDYSFKDIVNRVIIQGGNVDDGLGDGGTIPFTPDSTQAFYNDVPSQLKYGRHDVVYTNSSIITDAVAQQYAQSVLAEKKDVVHTATAELVNYEQRIETTVPIPLLEIVARGTLYGEKQYGTFLYSGKIQYRVVSAVYTLNDDDSSLTVDLTIGTPRPQVSEQIAQLLYKIQQLQTAALS